MSKKERKGRTEVPIPERCRKCGHGLVLRTKLLNPKRERNKCHFTEWKYCRGCRSIFLEEKNRVWHQPKPPKEAVSAAESSQLNSDFLRLIKNDNA